MRARRAEVAYWVAGYIALNAGYSGRAPAAAESCLSRVAGTQHRVAGLVRHIAGGHTKEPCAPPAARRGRWRGTRPMDRTEGVASCVPLWRGCKLRLGDRPAARTLLINERAVNVPETEDTVQRSLLCPGHWRILSAIRPSCRISRHLTSLLGTHLRPRFGKWSIVGARIGSQKVEKLLIRREGANAYFVGDGHANWTRPNKLLTVASAISERVGHADLSCGHPPGTGHERGCSLACSRRARRRAVPVRVPRPHPSQWQALADTRESARDAPTIWLAGRRAHSSRAPKRSAPLAVVAQVLAVVRYPEPEC